MQDHQLDHGLDLLGRRLADHVGEGLADDGVLVGAEGARIGLVGELALEITGAVVGDQHRHVVGKQPEQAGLRARLALDPLARAGVVQQAQPLPGVGAPTARPLDPGRLATGAGPGQRDGEVLPPRETLDQLATAVCIEQFLPRAAEQPRGLAPGEGGQRRIDVQRVAGCIEQHDHARQRIPGRAVDRGRPA